MNVNPAELITATDRRRAAALLAQVASGDLEGALAVMHEDTSADGLGGILAGLCDVILAIAPPLGTPEGVELLRRVAAGYAHAEATEARQ